MARGKNLVKNITAPQRTVKLMVTSNQENEPKKIVVDFKSFPKWGNTIQLKDGKFTNHYIDVNEYAEILFGVLHKLLPYIQDQGEKIFHCGGHNHRIIDNKKRKIYPRTVAKQIILDLHGVELDDETEIWQLGVYGGVRLIAVLLSRENFVELYPLFIDSHHLLYPDDYHNQLDFNKTCSFIPQDVYS
ncbi:hypothetical protein [Enterococcus raffinosus]|uniref:Uncharacterized protein n=1 Tax=Enterococcus raffinosus TaxID=71452 RepID=A0AAW8TDQ2_9ENTE|nr:hypothetical protein [Enterococcus raffinosus]MDT2525332.1 hypothetical protein [Enterococcus raffinosus]MDT2535923.1 hypothetical protein [Enterococcus raffinosus]MDT2546501.1 hypothetical protein [Enterococcus raffinosus]MDT2580404.1 hypothetical protein [Enterococcus raffinosus]MDT2592639.1 hypothetical protein [Enterococcus raffinosus]